MSAVKRIGIYSGSFDPVHAGHISFALQAIEAAKLDELYFLPERRPRYKTGVEHFAHRTAMLKRACKPYKRFHVLELEDISFTVGRTLPRLAKKFPGSQLVFLLGSDAATNLPEWPEAESLLKACELIIGVRGGDTREAVQQQIDSWLVKPKGLYVFESYAADVSSSQVRDALRARRYVHGLLTSVARYANRNWLYISLAKNN